MGEWLVAPSKNDHDFEQKLYIITTVELINLVRPVGVHMISNMRRDAFVVVVRNREDVDKVFFGLAKMGGLSPPQTFTAGGGFPLLIKHPKKFFARFARGLMLKNFSRASRAIDTQKLSPS